MPVVGQQALFDVTSIQVVGCIWLSCLKQHSFGHVAQEGIARGRSRSHDYHRRPLFHHRPQGVRSGPMSVFEAGGGLDLQAYAGRKAKKSR
eukprot:7142817-Alexandrium_andersonii.AAC.1